ncbi:MAG TPA: hypothetical protein VJ838_00075 [Gaiellaceae bacterium]|nr:hypothetical protein [Gaiellaceae bacterium]
MGRLVKWIGGTIGGIAAYRFVRRQEASLQTSPEPAAPEADVRADELRAKLAESRAPEPVAVEEPAAERGPQPDPEPEPAAPDERRRRVHEEGRAALDEMRSE